MGNQICLGIRTEEVQNYPLLTTRDESRNTGRSQSSNMRLISAYNPESFRRKVAKRHQLFGQIVRFGIRAVAAAYSLEEAGDVFASPMQQLTSIAAQSMGKLG